jgi:hypothetical protein
MSLPKLSLAGNNLWESLGSEILAGGGKINNLFYSVVSIYNQKIFTGKIAKGKE